MKCFWVFKHSWGKWKDISTDDLAVNRYGKECIVGSITDQKRYCKDCGKLQVRFEKSSL